MQFLKNTYTKIILISLFIISFCMLFTGYYPFGNYSFATLDCNSQYIPFIRELINKIFSNESILFNINKNLGSEGLFNYIYYATSPFNILFLLFYNFNPLKIVNFLVILKTILAGLSFCYFLKNEDKTHENITIILSLAYAFSGFMNSYSWCIIWTDVLILAPVIVTTLKKAISDKKQYKNYTLLLTLSMFCNLYMSFSLCIFILLYFLTLEFKDKKHFIENFARFSIYSIMSALINSPLIYLYLHAPTNNHTSTYNANISITDFIKEHLFLYNSSILSDSAKAYTLLIVLVLVSAYTFIHINKIHKVKRIILLAILILSFLINPLNMIWHVFDQPNFLYNRFAYLYIFYLLDLAYESYRYKNTVGNKAYISSGILIIIIIPLFLNSYINNISTALYAINICLIVFFTYSIFKKETKYLYVILIWELIFMLLLPMKTNANVTIDHYSLINKIEKTNDRTALSIDAETYYNMNSINNINSIAYFSSMHNEKANKKLLNYGFKTTMNSYVAQPYNYIGNSIFGIKYSVFNKEIDNNIFNLIKTDSNYYYENPYSLSIGYVVNESIKDINTIDNKTINDFFYKSCGVDNIYIDVINFEYIDGKYIFNSDDNYEIIAINYKYEFVSNLKILKNNTEIYNKNNPDTYITISDIKKGDVIEMELKEELKHEPEILVINNDNFKSAIELLKENQLEIDKQNSYSIKGHINSTKKGVLLLSLIYNERIFVYVNGEKVETYPIDELFTGVDVTEGYSSIEIIYSLK